MQVGRNLHILLAKGDVVIESYDAHDVCVLRLAIQILLDDLLIPVDNELLVEGGFAFLRQLELLVCLVSVLQPLVKEESIGESQDGAIRELLQAIYIHSVQFLKEVANLLIHLSFVHFPLLYLLLLLQGAILLLASLLVFLDVADQ